MITFASLATWLLVVIGLAIIAVMITSAEVAVKELMSLAGYFRLSTTFMGVTVVSLATSVPEIVAHFAASGGILAGTVDFKIASALVLGANIGSDVVQQTLIMATVVFIAGVVCFKRYFLAKSMVPMIVTTLMCLVLGWDRLYSRVDGLILLGSFFAYLLYLYVDERRHYDPVDHGFSEIGDVPAHVPNRRGEAVRSAVVALGALAVTVVSAMAALHLTEVIVHRTGLGGSLIGVVTLGVASALPELITAISGMRNGDAGISLGTLIGSNITNPLVAIGGGALLSTYWVPGPLVLWDLPWEALTGAALWVYLWFNKGRLGKKGGIYLVTLYAVYVALRFIFFAID